MSAWLHIVAKLLHWAWTGYRFPDFDKRAANVLNPSEVRGGGSVTNMPLSLTLELAVTEPANGRRARRGGPGSAGSSAYLLCEWRIPHADTALSQKLQELIRRGTPKDLAAAQELMKIMAGAVRRRHCVQPNRCTDSAHAGAGQEARLREAGHEGARQDSAAYSAPERDA